MQTIKTAVVVLLLMAVSYGAFVALNAPDPELPASIEEWASGDEQLEKLVGMDVAEFDVQSQQQAMQPMTAEELLAGMQSEPSQVVANAEQALKGLELPDLQMPELSNVGPEGMNLETPTGMPSLPDTTDSAQSNPVELEMPGGTDLSSFPALDPSAMQAIPGQSMPNAIPGASEQAPTSLIPSDFAAPNMGLVAGSNETPTQLASQGMVIDNPTVDITPGNAGTLQPTAPPTEKFAGARAKALDLANSGKLKEALVQLTPYFNSPELGSAESEDLTNILDALSREVIYSQRHFLMSAHVSRPSDTVASVASQYNMTPELLNAINGLGDAKALVPGTELKVVNGPFHASISLSKQELTLYLRDMYAGRFPVSFGRDPQPKQGAFEVVDRQRDRTYYGTGSVVIPGSDPVNPYGGYWINLGDEQCIHGAPEMESSELAQAGCVSLAPLDARDVFNILSLGSQVIITD